MGQGVTSGDSSECTRGSSGVQTMKEQEEAVAARGWERAAVDLYLLKSCLLHTKTGQGDTNGDGDQI